MPELRLVNRGASCACRIYRSYLAAWFTHLFAPLQVNKKDTGQNVGFAVPPRGGPPLGEPQRGEPPRGRPHRGLRQRQRSLLTSISALPRASKPSFTTVLPPSALTPSTNPTARFPRSSCVAAAFPISSSHISTHWLR